MRTSRRLGASLAALTLVLGGAAACSDDADDPSMDDTDGTISPAEEEEAEQGDVDGGGP